MERDRQKKRNVAKIETWKVKGPNIQNYKKCIDCGQISGEKIIITFITYITIITKIKNLILCQFWILGIFGGKTHYYPYYLYYHYYQNSKNPNPASYQASYDIYGHLPRQI